MWGEEVGGMMEGEGERMVYELMNAFSTIFERHGLGVRKRSGDCLTRKVCRFWKWTQIIICSGVEYSLPQHQWVTKMSVTLILLTISVQL